MSIHHIQIWVPDLGRADRSWGWLLTEVGFTPGRRWETGAVWRAEGIGIVLEQSPDMVPGMLYSRLRPGMNHIAFSVPTTEDLARIVDAATDHAWQQLGTTGRHALPPGTTVAYLEDTDGFEVELVVAGAP